jgi:hypothetical protein
MRVWAIFITTNFVVTGRATVHYVGTLIQNGTTSSLTGAQTVGKVFQVSMCGGDHAAFGGLR